MSKLAEPTSEPCLWVGMSNGVFVGITLMLPPNRITSSIVAAPSGGVLRQQGVAIDVSFLDKELALLSPSTDVFRDRDASSAPTSANPEKYQNMTKTKPSLSPKFAFNAADGTNQLPADELQQLGVFVSEYEVKVISLPGYHQVFHYKTDIPFVKVGLKITNLLLYNRVLVGRSKKCRTQKYFRRNPHMFAGIQH